ncbi:hypothetical protein Q5752_005039 [Cryptotrichosporon argae]
MMPQTVANLPPLLPLPRQPSPLSLSSSINQDPPHPAFPHASQSLPVPLASSLPFPTSVPLPPIPTSAPLRPAPQDQQLVPIQPAADSLLLRSTFAALEHSAVTLKRLSKSVLASTTLVLGLLEQVERAEDELLAGLGELGRWLEGGYDVDARVWDDDVGVRKVVKAKRAREREELEVMVEHSLKAVKAEIKRQGLAGAGAQTKFETMAKQYYQQTSAYLAPGQSSPAPAPFVDLAQAARSAHFDLARYNHHSTLLYAVPPSSVGCLDLLVGLYGWAGGQLGETPGAGAGAINDELDLPSPRAPMTRFSADGTDALKRSLAAALARLAQTRGTLLAAWGERDVQTTLLERAAARRQAQAERMADSGARETRDAHNTAPPDSPQPLVLPVSSAGVEHRRQRKMHKLHRSVGGRLRDLLSSSASSTSLATLAEKVGSTSAPGAMVGAQDRAAPASRHVGPGRASIDSNATPRASAQPTLAQAVDSSDASPSRSPEWENRPLMASRHSVQLTRGEDYHSPFLSPEEYPMPSREDKQAALAATAAKLSGLGIGIGVGIGVGGVGGIAGTGDEDEQREQVGRKKEGVLWGAGSWEGLDKGAQKGKWERFWVVLAHSKIYEYRDSGLGRPETAHAVIDLKFASVREGRGTDRRFVFEVVTSSQGRRLYQATSESEMKTWLYAICNAIESCINGTSSYRTFDASKLRTASGALDDHALPARHRLLPSPHRALGGAALGLGLPLPLPPSSSSSAPTPHARRSMPPPARPETPDDDRHGLRRARKTSFKNRLKQSAEVAGGKWSSVVSNVSGTRASVGPGAGAGTGAGTLDVPRPSFLAQGGRMPSYAAPSSASASASAVSVPTMATSANGRTTPLSLTVTRSDASPSSSRTHPSDHGHGHGHGHAHRDRDRELEGWYETSADSDIEKRVYEMAGLSLGTGGGAGTGLAPTRRLTGDTRKSPPMLAPAEAGHMARSQSAGAEAADGPAHAHAHAHAHEEPMDALRRIASAGANARCADCGKGMRSSRWATLSLRDVPMVMFICIRCCGLHRGLGTHISKPRSVDLDIWSADSVALAEKWGNERGNAVWECTKPASGAPADDEVAAYIRAKYVEGRWLSPEDRVRFGLDAPIVGRAL